MQASLLCETKPNKKMFRKKKHFLEVKKVAEETKDVFLIFACFAAPPSFLKPFRVTGQQSVCCIAKK